MRWRVFSRFRGKISFHPENGVEFQPTADGRGIALDSPSGELTLKIAFDDEARHAAETRSAEELEQSSRRAWAEFYRESRLPRLTGRLAEAARMAEYHLRISSTRYAMPIGLFHSHWEGAVFRVRRILHAARSAGAAGTLKQRRRSSISILRRCPPHAPAIFSTSAIRARRPVSFGSRSKQREWKAVRRTLAGSHLPHGACGAGSIRLLPGDAGRRVSAAVRLSSAERLRKLLSGTGGDPGRGPADHRQMRRSGAARSGEAQSVHDLLRSDFRRWSGRPKRRNIWESTRNGRNSGAERRRPCGSRSRAGNGRYLPCPDAEPGSSIALLSGLYPYGTLPAEDPAQRQAAEDYFAREQEFGNMYPEGNAICSWYANWKALALARLGRRAEARELLEQIAAETAVSAKPLKFWRAGNTPISPRRKGFSGSDLPDRAGDGPSGSGVLKLQFTQT